MCSVVVQTEARTLAPSVFTTALRDLPAQRQVTHLFLTYTYASDKHADHNVLSCTCLSLDASTESVLNLQTSEQFTAAGAYPCQLATCLTGVTAQRAMLQVDLVGAVLLLLAQLCTGRQSSPAGFISNNISINLYPPVATLCLSPIWSSM